MSNFFKNKCHYIIRLDDACPTMNHDSWTAIEQLLIKYDIKPIVAVIPNNLDPEFFRSNNDSNFWVRVRSWQSKGWHIGMHGYTHEVLTNHKGIVPIFQSKSEFAGLPYDDQCKRIRESIRIFRNKDVEPTVWAAPFGTFDATTLHALSSETKIRIVSEGIARWPFSRLGFFWIPVQLWSPIEKKNGIYTICLHPNFTKKFILEALEQLIVKNKSAFEFSMHELMAAFSSRRNSLSDFFQERMVHINRTLSGQIWFQNARRALSQAKRFLNS